MSHRETDNLRVLIANERKERLALVARSSRPWGTKEKRVPKPRAQVRFLPGHSGLSQTPARVK